MSSGLFLESRPHTGGESTLAFFVHLGTIIDSTQPISILFATLELSNDAGAITIEGPWNFEVLPDQLPNDPLRSLIAIQQDYQDDSIRFSAFHIEHRDSGTYLYFAITPLVASSILPVENWVSLEFEEGKAIQPIDVRALSDNGLVLKQGKPTALVAVFETELLPNGVGKLKIGSYVVRFSSSASFVVENPLGDWRYDGITAAT